MTNEDLALLIQAGERDRLPELWEQVQKFVARQARRRLVLSGGLGGVEFGDLYNSGYLALVAAAETYQPPASFLGWFRFYLLTAFAQAGGYQSRKQARDPLHRAGSLDAPVEGDDNSDRTRAELIEDPAAAQEFEDAERRVWVGQLHAALDQAMDSLSPAQADALRRGYWQGQTLARIAQDAGVSGERVRQLQRDGLRRLRRRRELRQFVEDRTPYYLHVGAKSGKSAVEQIFFLREQMRGEAGST